MTEAQSWDILTTEEAAFTSGIIDELSASRWALPLIADIRDNGGITRGNKSRFFELRLGYALHRKGIELQYEVAGEGTSTVDFGFEHGGQRWLIELMRLQETDAVRRATKSWTDGDGVELTQRALSSNAADQTQSEEGETLKGVERICQKCERGGRPHKFPEVGGAHHAILVDFRSFLEGTGDHADMTHIAVGGAALEAHRRRYWQGELIRGAFDSQNTLRGAQTLRERVHFIGFVKEAAYEAGAIEGVTYWVANPQLFQSEADAIQAITKWPSSEAKYLHW